LPAVQNIFGSSAVKYNVLCSASPDLQLNAARVGESLREVFA